MLEIQALDTAKIAFHLFVYFFPKVKEAQTQKKTHNFNGKQKHIIGSYLSSFNLC